jgi:hypothetical protein
MSTFIKKCFGGKILCTRLNSKELGIVSRVRVAFWIEKGNKKGYDGRELGMSKFLFFFVVFFSFLYFAAIC